MAFVPNPPANANQAVLAQGTSTGGNVPSATTPTAGGTTSGGAPAVAPSSFKLTQGWYVAAAVGTSILLANTSVAPFAMAIMSIALLYQVTLLLEGK